MDRARRARDKLLNQFRDHPDVTIIDIGYAPGSANQPEQLALRIHVREQWFSAKPAERIAFPADIDGIPVVVIRGDYRPQT